MSNSADQMRRLIEPSHLDLCCLQKPIIIACGSERVNVKIKDSYCITLAVWVRRSGFADIFTSIQ